MLKAISEIQINKTDALKEFGIGIEKFRRKKKAKHNKEMSQLKNGNLFYSFEKDLLWEIISFPTDGVMKNF